MKKNRRFFFESFWSEKEDCVNIIKQAWVGDASVNQKIVSVSTSLSKWSIQTFGNIPSRIKKIHDQMERLQNQAISSIVDEQLEALGKEYDSLLEQNEAIWVQRSIVNWLKGGDKNSKFFHEAAKQRGRKNRIRGVFDNNDLWQEKGETVGKIFEDYFSKLFTSEFRGTPPELLNAIPSLVDEEMNFNLCKPFTQEEIEFSLHQMYPIKAPGCDGLPALFYQRYWDVVKKDVVSCCLKVLNEGGSVKEINHTLIALIPKTKDPKLVTEFRPISLCNVLYK